MTKYIRHMSYAIAVCEMYPISTANLQSRELYHKHYTGHRCDSFDIILSSLV